MQNPLQLYIHIPFCVRKCGYCDFLSFPADDVARETYVCALIREIRAAGAVYGARPVTSVYIGGGTPTLLSSGQIKRLGTGLAESFKCRAEDIEFSAECNPKTADEEKLRALRGIGVNRLSIGLQSMNNKELKALGRIHTAGDFLKTYELARAAGFDNINIDLMQAVPYQTLPGWKRTLNAVLKLRPEHISAYSLIIEEGTPFYEAKENMRLPGLPSEDEEREIYYATKNILEADGYRRYEISNYSLPGFECRHNTGYWRRHEYLGLGLGASSLIAGTRWRNTPDMKDYLNILKNEAEPFAALRTDAEKLTSEAEMEEFMFLGLRLTDGISKREFSETFGCSFESVYAAAAASLSDKGLLACAGGRIFLTGRGIDVSNVALSEFLF